jgi:putative transposase
MHLPPLVLTTQQRDQLETVLRRSTSTQRAVERALIVLEGAGGRSLPETAERLGLTRNTIRKWRRRFILNGVDGLHDRPRCGRPRRITAEERCLVVAAACQDPADHELAGHSSWSGSPLAQVLVLSGLVSAISARSVQRILKAAAIKPHRIAYWKQKIDPLFALKMRPIVDLYLRPPANGPVVCADEKTCIQALSRRFPDQLPRRPGQLRRRSVEYVRHRTRCLTAAFFVHTGRVLALVTPRRPKEVFLAFLDLLDVNVPPVGHPPGAGQPQHPPRRAHRGLASRPSGSARDLLPALPRQLAQPDRALVRNALPPLPTPRRLPLRDDLAAKMLAFIETYNRLHAHPYRWTYTGDPLAA